ncbi:MAG: SET domain-containing protein [Candidatus Pseudobacter hemicellulosilyticus]|uniref:SET domain-containing protein n=1 Tax=Candidatus Pseudobacter hemicellulosilyticus TaxID=3121375 RepID=A0AAJ5WX85_9BACT|nr:MAG: SET domain-containing protein [Pseudobacter sp.]
MILPSLFIAPSGEMGRGVYTAKKLPSGTVIEISPVIVLPPADRPVIDQTLLHDYIFEWGEAGQSCVALGYISMYNHSYASNCTYDMDYESQLMTITTVRAVKAGEELFINYNGDWNNEKPLWFEAR